MPISQLCEIAMLCLFGCSWPFNIAKSIRSKTTKGKSIAFELLIFAGYIIGLFGKLYSYRHTGVLAYSVWFYIADILMVAIDLVLYFINARRDRAAAANEQEAR